MKSSIRTYYPAFIPLLPTSSSKYFVPSSPLLNLFRSRIHALSTEHPVFSIERVPLDFILNRFRMLTDIGIGVDKLPPVARLG